MLSSNSNRRSYTVPDVMFAILMGFLVIFDVSASATTPDCSFAEDANVLLIKCNDITNIGPKIDDFVKVTNSVVPTKNVPTIPHC